ncbi:BRI1 kinase inhibitor 1-like [Chenopodium quinoa]|uniref:BRI1 kinase inhibitor 1 n=1 Tax=Chenopodium quinoa TaxID=63459 RepID=A0A803M2H1_CHEQI|nr:BRI1 kinase inhibitor 1-like [Chenopodium quinoa]
METQQQVRHENRNIRDSETEGKEVAEQVQQQRTTPGASATNSPASSPSHEFSFTISLHTSATTTPKASSSPSLATKSKNQQEAPLAIDLSPADEIFFHGHLLPLHFLSHLHASSARPSTHSLDGFSSQIRDAFHEEKPLTSSTTDNSSTTCSCTEDDQYISFDKDYSKIEINNNISRHDFGSKERSSSSNNKFKSFSLFGLSKWKKLSDSKEKTEHPENCSRRNKLKSDVTQFLKRYINMVKPLLSPKGGGRRDSVRVRRQSYSFSGTVSPRDNRELMRGRRGEFSAPASMRTSPTNSGLLLATAGVPSPSSDSTMEELQAAIQAAIAHCKNSISTEDKKSQEISSSIPVN